MEIMTSDPDKVVQPGETVIRHGRSWTNESDELIEIDDVLVRFPNLAEYSDLHVSVFEEVTPWWKDNHWWEGFAAGLTVLLVVTIIRMVLV
jgi:hypothetical protein|tara:strand:- start:1383 stop:1655 length:273 start_codon:yes stop_codon:yes gene_type:complete